MPTYWPNSFVTIRTLKDEMYVDLCASSGTEDPGGIPVRVVVDVEGNILRTENNFTFCETFFWKKADIIIAYGHGYDKIQMVRKQLKQGYIEEFTIKTKTITELETMY